MQMHKQMNKINKHSGFSLVEVLVTLMITTIALLGSISLQVVSKRSVYDAMQRTSAAHLANDLFSRMRANSTSLVNYLPGGTLGQGSMGFAPASDCLNPGADCTNIELAGYDLWQWEQHLDGQLEQVNNNPVGGLMSATACVAGPVGGGSGNYQIAIAWRGRTGLTNPAINNCGAGTGLYGANDEFRRVLVIDSFVAAR
jgi:type IV pilus assembly protein PilV